MSEPVPLSEAGSSNPFVRYRWLLESYQMAMARGWSDSDFVALVERLDEAVAGVAGHGFAVTPLTCEKELANALSLPRDRLWVKDETGNVGGSHKARHLFGVLLHLAIDNHADGELAIASCGNAALAAALVAKAADRPLRVFIPTWADSIVVAELERLGAATEICERVSGQSGDPTYQRLQKAVAGGAVPFSVQGTITPTALDGGRTIGWELAEQLALARVAAKVRLFVQVGGGALAASLWQGFNDGVREQWLAAEPVLFTVQTEAAAPLNRAWRILRDSIAATAEVEADSGEVTEQIVELASAHPERYMWPWDPVGMSVATGILDDVTYDWLPVTRAMISSHGMAYVVTEDQILEINRIARAITGVAVDATGTAGLAPLLDSSVAASIQPEDHVVGLFTGASRQGQ